MSQLRLIIDGAFFANTGTVNMRPRSFLENLTPEALHAALTDLERDLQSYMEDRINAVSDARVSNAVNKESDKVYQLENKIKSMESAAVVRMEDTSIIRERNRKLHAEIKELQSVIRDRDRYVARLETRIDEAADRPVNKCDPAPEPMIIYSEAYMLKIVTEERDFLRRVVENATCGYKAD